MRRESKNGDERRPQSSSSVQVFPVRSSILFSSLVSTCFSFVEF